MPKVVPLLAAPLAAQVLPPQPPMAAPSETPKLVPTEPPTVSPKPKAPKNSKAASAKKVVEDARPEEAGEPPVKKQMRAAAKPKSEVKETAAVKAHKKNESIVASFLKPWPGAPSKESTVDIAAAKTIALVKSSSLKNFFGK